MKIFGATADDDTGRSHIKPMTHAHKPNCLKQIQSQIYTDQDGDK